MLRSVRVGYAVPMTNDDEKQKDSGGQADEDAKERVDRELIELLNELRVALPGVQVLFAFLLTLPFTQAFGKISGVGETAYVVALLAAALSTALFILPTSMHRLTFREGTKEQLLFTSNRAAIGGLALLLVAIVAVIVVVFSALFDNTVAFLVAGAVALWFGWFWYALPLRLKGD